MSYQTCLFVLCLARLSLGEPPVAPYPPAGSPSGPAFTGQGGSSNQFQDLPEIISARSNNGNEQPNHRIHFNLFKDHETKKSKDNISFKLGQGEGQFRNGGDQNFGRNFQGDQGYNYNNQERNSLSQRHGGSQTSVLGRSYGSPNFNQQHNDFARNQGQDISSRYGAPQTSALSRSYGSPNFNEQNNGFTRNQGQEISSRYGAPNQNFGPSSTYGNPNQGFDQRQISHQTNYRSSAGSNQHEDLSKSYQQPQSQYGPPQGVNAKSFTNVNRLSESYGSPLSSGLFGRSNQQPSSTYGTPRNQPGSYQYPATGAPPQGRHGQDQLRRMDSFQQRNQFNPQDIHNQLQKQGGGYQKNADDRYSEEMTERANYEFEYEVRGEQSHGHEESREGDEAWGSYKVQLPDGRTMLVEYTADDRGYRPKITYSGHQNDEQPY